MKTYLNTVRNSKLYGNCVEGLLQRINYEGELDPNFDTLCQLHQCHVGTIPFENIDVQNKVPIHLDLKHLYQKVVSNKRGGFCYELNYLFHSILSEIGFKVTMISARVFDEHEPGPEFDHMALLISLNDQKWLADVGFGDLFVQPVEFKPDVIQSDGRNFFKIEVYHDSWLLLMSKDKLHFEKKYQFSTTPRNITDFHDQCHFKQCSPDSHFVRNTVVTLPHGMGRKTIHNDKFTVKQNGKRKETLIRDRAHLLKILDREFDIQI